MMHCLNLNDPTISNIISRIGYLTTSDIITYNGIEILDIVKQQPFLDLKEEIKKSYQYQLNTKEFNQSIDDMVEISFWRIFTPSFYDWFGNWMIQYKLQNNLSLSEKEQDVLATKYQGSYDNLKADISKIVTEDGLPKLVYHSSLYDFPIFKNRDYIHFGTLKAAEDRLDVMIGRLPFTNDNQFSSILEEQLSNISSQPNAIAGITIKPYFLNIKKVIVSEDVIAGWTGKVLLDELNSGIEYKNELEDKGSISYAIRDINQTKSAILPSEDMSALLVKNLVEELKVTPEQAKPLIPTKFLNPTDSKIMYFQRLNDSTYGFVTPDGKVFIDKSTQSLNTPFHEFYHIYDKIILSNYSFDERAKSIIDKLNELVVESGYLDRVKKLDAYKNKSHDEQLAEARATLVGDAASSKINEAEYTFLMKIKKVLKDLVDYILDLIGTKSFKDYSPEQILNMTMEEFTNVMTYDMMYNRSFEINKIIGNVPFSDLIIDTVKSKLKKLYPDITFDNSITTNPNDIITEDDEVKLENYMLNYLQEIEKMKNIDFKTYIKELKVSYKVINDKKYYIELISDNNLRLSYTHIGPFSESELNDFVNNDLKTYINKENISFNLDSYNSMKQDLADNEYYAKEYLSLLKERKNKNKTNRFQKYKDTETLPIYIQQLAKEILEIDFPDYSETLSKDFHALPLITNLTNKYAKTISEYYYEYKDVFTYFLAYAYPTAWGENGILYIEHEIAQVSFHIMDNDADTIAIIHGLNPYNKKWSEIEVQFIAEELIEKYIDKNNILPDRIDTEFEIEKQFINNSKLKRIKYPNIQFQDLTSIKPGVEELFDSNPELANAVYETAGLKTLENNKLEQDIKELIKGREDIPSSIFLSYLVDNNLIPKIQEYITSIGYRHGEWNELYKRLTLDYSPINTKSEKTKLISHELMHALSHKYITSYEALRQPDFKQYIDKINENEKIKGTNRTIELVNLTKEQLDALDNLVRIKEKVFDFIKAGKFNKNEKLTNANFGSLNYAFSELDKKEDIHEFISEAFSNPILIDVLKQIPTEGNKSNLFKEFIKALKIILGFNDESIIEDILYYSEKAFINEALKESNTKKQQALQLYSQYLESLNKPNTNPILQDNQQEQVKKFAELQERLSNKEFLEGAKLAFESSEELQKFGTQEEYNDYIARVSLGIIRNPTTNKYNNSLTTDIWFHGTNADPNIIKFLKPSKDGTYGPGIYLQSKQGHYFTGTFGKNTISIIADVKKTYSFDKYGVDFYNEQRKKYSSDKNINDKLKNILHYMLMSENYDSIADNENISKYLVILNPDFFPSSDRLHILSSTQDIQGFKEFISKNQNVQLQTDNNLISTQQSETYDYVFEKLFENFNPYVTELTTDRKRAQEILNGYDTVQYQDKKIEKDELKIDMAEKINDINRNKEIENQIKQFNNDDANSYWSLSTNEEEIKRILKFKYPLLDFVIINEYLDLDNFDNSQVLKAKIKVEPYKNIFYGQTHANLHLDIFQIEDVESEHIVKSLDSLLNKTDDTMPIYINDRIYYRINDSIFKSGPIRLQYNNFDIISDSEFDRLKEITDIAFEEISSDDFLYLDDMLYYMENNIADDLNQQTRGKIALLKDIKEKSPVEYYSILAKYLINSLPLLYDESFSFGNYSQSNTYNPQNDALSYSIEYRNYIPVLLHELMHNFQTPDTAYTHKEEEFINKITELYKMAVGQVLDNYFDLPFDYYRNYSEVVGKDGKSYYGLVNINEFIAESMTNPEFQRYLSTIKTNNGKSVFEEIYDAVVKLIKSLLNEDISTESNLLIDTIDTIVDFMEKHNIHENVGKELMWDRWKVDIINKDPSMTYDIWQSLTNKEKLQIINCL